jgi:hypothetical protein
MTQMCRTCLLRKVKLDASGEPVLLYANKKGICGLLNLPVSLSTY